LTSYRLQHTVFTHVQVDLLRSKNYLKKWFSTYTIVMNTASKISTELHKNNFRFPWKRKDKPKPSLLWCFFWLANNTIQTKLTQVEHFQTFGSMFTVVMLCNNLKMRNPGSWVSCCWIKPSNKEMKRMKKFMVTCWLKNSGEACFERIKCWQWIWRLLVSSVCVHYYQMTLLWATKSEKVHNHQNFIFK